MRVFFLARHAIKDIPWVYLCICIYTYIEPKTYIQSVCRGLLVLLPIQKFEVSTKIPGIHSKADHPSHMLKALTLETLDHEYPKCSWIHIYIDGSAERAEKTEKVEWRPYILLEQLSERQDLLGCKARISKQKCFW